MRRSIRFPKGGYPWRFRNIYGRVIKRGWAPTHAEAQAAKAAFERTYQVMIDGERRGAHYLNKALSAASVVPAFGAYSLVGEAPPMPYHFMRQYTTDRCDPRNAMIAQFINSTTQFPATSAQ